MLPLRTSTLINIEQNIEETSQITSILRTVFVILMKNVYRL